MTGASEPIKSPSKSSSHPPPRSWWYGAHCPGPISMASRHEWSNQLTAKDHQCDQRCGGFMVSQINLCMMISQGPRFHAAATRGELTCSLNTDPIRRLISGAPRLWPIALPATPSSQHLIPQPIACKLQMLHVVRH